MPAAGIGRAKNTLTDRIAGDFSTGTVNRPNNLMARYANGIRGIHAMISMKNSQIGPTNAGAQNLYQQVAFADYGDRDFFNPQVVWAVIDSR
jgi:hypothetical protein